MGRFILSPEDFFLIIGPCLYEVNKLITPAIGLFFLFFSFIASHEFVIRFKKSWMSWSLFPKILGMDGSKYSLISKLRSCEFFKTSDVCLKTV